MNRTAFFGTLVLAAVDTSAFADDITIDPNPFVSSRTRAEVQCEARPVQAVGGQPVVHPVQPAEVLPFRQEPRAGGAGIHRVA